MLLMQRVSNGQVSHGGGGDPWRWQKRGGEGFPLGSGTEVQLIGGSEANIVTAEPKEGLEQTFNLSSRALLGNDIQITGRIGLW